MIVQLGPGISASHSRVFNWVPCNSLEGIEVLCTRWSHFPHQLFKYKKSGLSIARKLISLLHSGTASILVRWEDHLPLWLLLEDRAILPFYAARWFGWPWAPHVIGSRSRHTLGIGQFQSLQGAGNILLLWLVLDSPLSQCQCSAQETRCPRHCDDSGPGVTTLLSSCALRSKLSARFRPSRRPTKKKSSPCIRMWVDKPVWKKWHGEATPRENLLASKTWALCSPQRWRNRALVHSSSFNSCTFFPFEKRELREWFLVTCVTMMHFIKRPYLSIVRNFNSHDSNWICPNFDVIIVLPRSARHCPLFVFAYQARKWNHRVFVVFVLAAFFRYVLASHGCSGQSFLQLVEYVAALSWDGISTQLKGVVHQERSSSIVSCIHWMFGTCRRNILGTLITLSMGCTCGFSTVSVLWNVDTCLYLITGTRLTLSRNCTYDMFLNVLKGGNLSLHHDGNVIHLIKCFNMWHFVEHRPPCHWTVIFAFWFEGTDLCNATGTSTVLSKNCTYEKSAVSWTYRIGNTCRWIMTKIHRSIQEMIHPQTLRCWTSTVQQFGTGVDLSQNLSLKYKLPRDVQIDPLNPRRPWQNSKTVEWARHNHPRWTRGGRTTW